jgi:hypothetical protein
MTQAIHCCTCNKEVTARLTTGEEIYPHRTDLHNLPFWKCDCCGNYVGCHHKTKDRTKPLGVIPSAEVKNARLHLHELIDPLWNKGLFNRKELYKEISTRLGYEYHTAMIKSVEEARVVYKTILGIKKELLSKHPYTL